MKRATEKAGSVRSSSSAAPIQRPRSSPRWSTSGGRPTCTLTPLACSPRLLATAWSILTLSPSASPAASVSGPASTQEPRSWTGSKAGSGSNSL
eukprot:7342165-Pyramimonas_sp.AAC.1